MKGKANLLWLVYGGFLVAVGFARLIERFVSEKGGFSSRFLPVLLLGMMAIGIVSSLRGRALGHNWFWKAIFFLSALAGVLLALGAVYLAVASAGAALAPALILFLVAVVLLPAQYRLWKYAFRSPEIWEAGKPLS